MATLNTVFLKDAKLRQLAEVIRLAEVREMYNIRFPNVGEQNQYIMMANNNMISVFTILDECNMLVNRYQADGVRSPIADLILRYAEHCLNNALQLFSNYTLRRDYLDKMMEHHNQLFRAVEDLDTTSRSAADDLAETIREYDQMVVGYMLLNLNSHASAEFSQYLRNIGIGFDELVRTNQVKLGYTGKFEDLDDEQKLEVYTEIIDASGRFNGLETSELRKGGADDEIIKIDRSTMSFGRKKSRWGSAAMFLMDIGIIIWDVYSSGHTITEAVRAAVVAAAEAGGAALGKVVGAAVAKMVGAAATSMFAAAVGMIAGFVAAFILGLAAGFLFDLIVGSGGEKPIPEDPHVYVARMPDGHLLARQLA